MRNIVKGIIFLSFLKILMYDAGSQPYRWWGIFVCWQGRYLYMLMLIFWVINSLFDLFDEYSMIDRKKVVSK